MALLAAVILFAVNLIIINAHSDLNVQQNVAATWKRTVTLPCSYSPGEDTQKQVTWCFKGKIILLRDSTGTHTFLSKDRGRLSLPIDLQGGDVSLTIQILQIDEKGTYTCEVSLTPKGTSDTVIMEATINLDVKKVPVTKPVIQPKGSLLEVSEGAAVNLTCSAEGSPEITYRWNKHVPGGRDERLTKGANLVFPNAQTSDSGVYFCEAENWTTGKKVQQSEVLQLTVTGDTGAPTTTPKLRMSSTERMGITEHAVTTRGHEPQHTIAPSSTKDDAVRQSHHSTRIPDTTMGTTEALGNKGRPPTTKESGTTHKQTHGSNRPSASTKDDAVRQTHHSTRIPDTIMGTTEALRNKGRPPTTKESGTTEKQTHGSNKPSASTKGLKSTAPSPVSNRKDEMHNSSGMTLYLIILVSLLSLALICTLIAVLVTRSKKKATDRMYEMPAMSVLNARANQDSPAANGCQMNICQINSSQTNGCQSNGMAGPRKENDYLPMPIKDHTPESDYQDIQGHHENEYELLLTEKEKECEA